MNLWKHLLSVLMAAALLAPVTSAATATAPLALDLQPDEQNASAPTMGDHMRFWSTITNAGKDPIEGLVAWISLIEIDPGNEQPVDLEDWSAFKAITGASLKPGQSLQTDWPMRLIKAGDYRVMVSVTDRGSHTVFSTPTIQFHVQQKPVLQTKRVLPVAAGVPFLLVGLMIFNKARRRYEKEQA